MTYLSKVIILCAGLALTACTDADRFGNSGGGDPNAAGAVGDPSSPAYFQQTVGDRVLFVVDQSTLTATGQATLDGQAQWLMTNTAYNAIIEGHADEQGTREYNLALGARRANSVHEYLTSRGVASNRVQVVSFGKERPIEICSEESCYTQNRRAVTVISAGGAICATAGNWIARTAMICANRLSIRSMSYRPTDATRVGPEYLPSFILSVPIAAGVRHKVTSPTLPAGHRHPRETNWSQGMTDDRQSAIDPRLLEEHHASRLRFTVYLEAVDVEATWQMLARVATRAPLNHVRISRLHPVNEHSNLLSELVVHTQVDVPGLGEGERD